MAIFLIPTLLVPFTGGEQRVDVPGRTIGECINALNERYPGIRDRLVEDGELDPSLAVSIDGELGLQGVLEPVSPTAEVVIIPAISGG